MEAMLSSTDEMQLCALSKCQLVQTSTQNTHSDTFKPSIAVIMKMSVKTTAVVSMVTGHHDTFIYIHIYSREISAVLQNKSL
jgi:hypothetical protein